MPTKCVKPIRYCGRGPQDKCCYVPLKPEPKVKCYYPCPNPNPCPCPESWPTLLPRIKCCIREPCIQDPLGPPVMPLCRPPRWLPEKCKSLIRYDPPLKYNPPLIPKCLPCRPLCPPPPPRPPKIRCLNPVIPACPRTYPRTRICHPPEPPYPPVYPIFPPCNCQDMPLICHNSVIAYRPTSSCDKAKDTNDARVCYVPVDRREIAQVSCDLGCCYEVCC